MRGLWIVSDGEAWPMGDRPLPRREDYGTEWVAVEAEDAAGAIDAGLRYDAGEHLDIGVSAFAAAYRGGAMGLPSDEMVGVAEVAERAGVKADTVHAWRQRHPTFPDPAQDLAMGPVWWWSDVERWLAVERRVGRPSKG